MVEAERIIKALLLSFIIKYTYFYTVLSGFDCRTVRVTSDIY